MAHVGADKQAENSSRLPRYTHGIRNAAVDEAGAIAKKCSLPAFCAFLRLDRINLRKENLHR